VDAQDNLKRSSKRVFLSNTAQNGESQPVPWVEKLLLIAMVTVEECKVKLNIEVGKVYANFMDLLRMPSEGFFCDYKGLDGRGDKVKVVTEIVRIYGRRPAAGG
jgi:hypothetical protein